MLVPVLAVFGIKRPLLVVIAATVSLWGATLWAGGSWILSLLWVVLATVLVYLSLIWLNRIRGNGAAILFYDFICDLSTSCLGAIITVH